MLTLLKQARAYRTWASCSRHRTRSISTTRALERRHLVIGRLQTERDKARVIEGLEGASAGASFDRGAMEKLFAGLGKRVFLLHNVHETAPVVFQTRWTLSYLAGPLTRDQIHRLAPGPATPATQSASASAGATTAAGNVAPAAPSAAPVVPAGIAQFHLESAGTAPWQPVLLGIADVTISSTKYDISSTERVLHTVHFDDGPVAVEWSDATALNAAANAVKNGAPDGGSFAELPTSALKEKNYAAWLKGYQQWLKTNEVVTLYRSAALKLTSSASESEGGFRARLQVASREARDRKVADIRQQYATKLAAIQDRVMARATARKPGKAGVDRRQGADSGLLWHGGARRNPRPEGGERHDCQQDGDCGKECGPDAEGIGRC